MKINLLKTKVEENMEKDQMNNLEMEEVVALEDNLMVDNHLEGLTVDNHLEDNLMVESMDLEENENEERLKNITREKSII